MHRMLTLSATTVIVVAGLAGCSTGPTVTQERDIQDATAVELVGSGDLVITRGEPALTITAGSGIIDRLTSEVRDGTLRLDRRPGFGVPWGEVRYELSLPTVESVEIKGIGDVAVDFTGADDVVIAISGSGDVTGTGIDAATVRISISGSGEVEVSGSTQGFDASISGSGTIEAGSLESSDSVVSIAGAGDIRVHATGTLDATISGSGSVRYSGDATVSSQIRGSGEVVQD